MMALPRGRRLEWFTVRVTEVKPKTFDLEVIFPEKISPLQLNDIIARVRGVISAGDNLSIDRPKNCITVATGNIEEIIKRLYFKNVRTARANS